MNVLRRRIAVCPALGQERIEITRLGLEIVSTYTCTSKCFVGMGRPSVSLYVIVFI